MFNLHPGGIHWGGFIIFADCGERDCLVGGHSRVEFASVFTFKTCGEVPCGSCTLVSSVVVEWGVVEGLWVEEKGKRCWNSE